MNKNYNRLGENVNMNSNVQRKRKMKKRKLKINMNGLKRLIALILILGFAIVGGITAYVIKIIVTSPDITSVLAAPKGYSTFIYDEKGKEVDRLHTVNSNRVYAELSDIPQDLQDAVVSMEDKRFYKHNGIDYQGLARALAIDVITLSKKQGASTLTQQLIKNNVLTAKKHFDRKIREMYLATVLEKKLSKNSSKLEAKHTILEYYLNTINLGKGCYGVQSAANRYFGKDVSKLTLDECTVLASIIQTPNKLEPINHSEENNKRRQLVLKAMLNQDMITKEEYEASKIANPYSSVKDYNTRYEETKMENSYFVDTLIEEITTDLMNQRGLSEELASQLIYTGGLRIYSTMNVDVQRAIDSVFNDEASKFATEGAEYQLIYNLDLEKKDGAPKYFQKTTTISDNKEETVTAAINELKAALMEDGDKITQESHYLQIQPQSSMVVLDYRTGQVKGIAGGRGEKIINRGLNRATQSLRQAGSTFKVLAAFAPAIDMKIKTAASIQDDIPFYLQAYGHKEIKNWYDYQKEKYRGLSTLRDGTRDSMNIVASKTIMDVGIDNAFNYLTKFGITSLVDSRKVNGKVYTDRSPSMALGGLTDGVTLLELTAAYGAIANEGILNKPIFYTKVEDINGKILLTKETTSSKVLEPETAYIVTTMMRDVITYGTGGSASVRNQYVAGKTGTTTSSKDLTFAGYTPYYAAGIWVGHDTPKVIKGDQSIHTKAWSQVMTKIHANLPYKEFDRPSTVVTASVCAESGLLAVPGLCDCDQRGSRIYTEYFTEDTVPTEQCNVHVRAKAVKQDGKFYLAAPGITPADAEVQDLVFIRRPKDPSSYYDVNIKDSIGDAYLEIPTEYYNPFGFEIPDTIDRDDRGLVDTLNGSGDEDDTYSIPFESELKTKNNKTNKSKKNDKKKSSTIDENEYDDEYSYYNSNDDIDESVVFDEF